jgi:hypothetical protein
MKGCCVDQSASPASPIASGGSASPRKGAGASRAAPPPATRPKTSGSPNAAALRGPGCRPWRATPGEDRPASGIFVIDARSQQAVRDVDRDDGLREVAVSVGRPVFERVDAREPVVRTVEKPPVVPQARVAVVGIGQAVDPQGPPSGSRSFARTSRITFRPTLVDAASSPVVGAGPPGATIPL